MSLCLICRDVRGDAYGGLQRSMGDLAEAFAEQGHSVHLLTDASDAAAVKLRGVAVHTVRIPAGSGPFADPDPETAPHNLMYAAAAYRRIRELHEHDQPVDVVLAPLWRSEGAVCVLDSSFPTVITCMTSLRTLAEVDPRYRSLPDIEQRLSLEREALTRASYLHGLTEAALRKTIEDYDLDPVQTAVVGRGLRDRTDHQAVVSDGARPLNVLFVGRLERRKGVDTLLDAARLLIDAGVSVSFTLVGPNADPRFAEAFERHAEADPRRSRGVRFAGAVPDAELDRLYAHSDIACVPSRYESHGVVLIEAMMFRKPIVTCGTGGIGEVVQPEHNAVLCPPGDAVALASSLRRLLDDPALRRRLGDCGRASFEQRFDVRIVAKQMEALLAGVAGRHRRLAGRKPEVRSGLAELVQGVLGVTADEAGEHARELLSPAGTPGAHRLQGGDRELASWRERALASEARELELERRILILERKLQAMLGSRSWRVTMPPRRIAARLREGRNRRKPG